MTTEQIAQICHEANRSYCNIIGDGSQLCWDDAAEWQRESAVKGVEFAVANPNAPANLQHDAWLKAKAADGWKYGAIKDAAKKEHPCFRPYDKLPDEQKRKDALFKAIVSALSDKTIPE